MQEVKRLYNLRMQPYVVTVENSSKVFVIVDNHMYECSSVLTGIDSVFKLCMSLNIDYNFECSHIWKLIQIYIFDIRTKYDKKNKKLSNVFDIMTNIFLKLRCLRSWNFQITFKLIELLKHQTQITYL